MLFNSYIFVLLFLPLCLAGYYGLGFFQKYRLANVFLLGMSLWFYGYFNPWYLIIIISSVCFNYLIYRLMLSHKDKKKVLMVIGVCLNVAVLFYFKYMDFFISTVNMLFKTEFNLLYIVLPLGISFFTFQQISFIVDSYKGDVTSYSFLEYACYVIFFPQLIAGPIVTHDELVPQLMDDSKKHINAENFARGIYLFTIGMAKKVLIADTLGCAVNYGYDEILNINSTEAIVVILAYTLQIYFDFSGYCDMAIGIGQMFNINLPLNFNSPYKAVSIDDFWDRWHMTLTRFLTRYIYIPLGGNRKGKVRTYVNIFIVFLVSGFWHGAGFTFILWGVGHGIASIIHRMGRKFFDKVPKIIGWAVTFFFVNIMWVFFRADSIATATELIRRAFSGHFDPLGAELTSQFSFWELHLILDKLPVIKNFDYIDVVGMFTVALFIALIPKNGFEKMKEFTPNVINMLVMSCLMIWCILSFSGISTFLYFNF